MIEEIEVFSFAIFCCLLIFLICLLIKITRQKNKQKKSTQPQQKTYQKTTYYDNFNQETYKPLQQRVVKDFYKEYSNFDPIKPKKTKVKNTTYDNLLHNDNWKIKRDNILKRDNYTCRYCGRHDGILQVHHKYYNVYPDGTRPKPWDYPDDALITLCDNCHKRVHKNTKIKTYYRKKYLHYYN